MSAGHGTGGAGRRGAGKGGCAQKDQGWKTRTLIEVEEKEVRYCVGKKKKGSCEQK